MFLSRPTGTFITEWKEGERLCEAFLAGDERSYQAVARQLVLIAQFFRFDGWLINIENSLSVSTPAPVPRGDPPSHSSASSGRSLLRQHFLRLSWSRPLRLCLFTGRWMFSSTVSRNLAR